MHIFLVAFFLFAAANLGPLVEVNRQVAGWQEFGSKDCQQPKPGEFSVCAEESVGSGGGGLGGSDGPAMRECRYFANGTIDVPTMTIITAWVTVGSRLCLGDEIPKPSSSSDSWQNQAEIELRDKFTAFATRPIAIRTPLGEVEFEDLVSLRVQADTEVVTGTLLGRQAQIRFRPVSARWELSDGSSLFGFQKSHSFRTTGTFVARAFVNYEVDYRHSGGNWVFNATSWELGANKLTIVVIERERRTLLVG